MDTSQPPTGTSPPALRASDSDREHVATVLRENYAEGRLTIEEFQERLEQTYKAMTLSQLETLTADLPGHPPFSVSQPVAAPGTRSRYVQRRILRFVLLMLFLIAIWAAAGRHGFFWPIWPIIIGGFFLLRNMLDAGPWNRRDRTYRTERRQERLERRRARYERRIGRRDE